MVDLGYIILSKLPIFRSNIWKWIRCNPANQTWSDFQATFTEAYQELRGVEASVDKIGFQYANAIVYQIVQEFRSETPHTSNNLLNEENFPPPHISQPPETPAYPPIVASTQDHYISLFAAIQENMDDICLQTETHHTNAIRGVRGSFQVWGRGRGGFSQGRERGHQNIPRPRRGSSYCYTNSNYAHTSGEYETPFANHQ